VTVVGKSNPEDGDPTCPYREINKKKSKKL
jgi:hypothetical protein